MINDISRVNSACGYEGVNVNYDSDFIAVLHQTEAELGQV